VLLLFKRDSSSNNNIVLSDHGVHNEPAEIDSPAEKPASDVEKPPKSPLALEKEPFLNKVNRSVGHC